MRNASQNTCALVDGLEETHNTSEKSIVREVLWLTKGRGVAAGRLLLRDGRCWRCTGWMKLLQAGGVDDLEES